LAPQHINYPARPDEQSDASICNSNNNREPTTTKTSTELWMIQI
jgi:hypothetical protein